MRFKELVLTEKMATPKVPGDPNTDPLYSLKAQIAHKIKDLPPTKEVKSQLGEIQDILAHIDLGKSRRKGAEELFAGWKDSDVAEAKDYLARYIVSMNAPIEQKQRMLTLWGSKQGLINTKLMLTPGKNSVVDIVRGYGKNPAITELVDDLIMVDSLGKGKGEFMLKVLSPQITKPDGTAGDVEVRGVGTLEVKTQYESGGKLGDQNVKPGPGYSKLVTEFFSKFAKYWAPSAPQQEPVQQEPVQQEPVQQEPVQQAPVQQAPVQQAPVQPTQVARAPVKQTPLGQAKPMGEARTAKPKAPIATKDPYAKAIPKSGMSLTMLSLLYLKVPTKEERQEFQQLLIEILELIWEKKPEYAKPVTDAIISGNGGQAKQLYGVACVTNYMEQKHDIGILFIDLKKKPTEFVFFKDNATLNSGGLRIHISTAYPVTRQLREIYPSTTVQETGRQQTA